MDSTEQLNGDYTQMLQKLLPRGPAWSDADPLLAGLAPAFAAVHQRANDLIQESDPLTTTELLDRWEACCGLPDSCSVPGTETTAQRQQRLNTKVNAQGGITAAFYIGILNDLGYPDATITTVTKHAFLSTSTCTASLADTGKNFYWQVNFSEATAVTEMTCLGSCTDSLRVWGGTMAECVIEKLCASHTIVLFSYPSEVSSAAY